MKFKRGKAGNFDVLEFKAGGKRIATEEEVELLNTLDKACDLIERMGRELMAKKRNMDEVTRLYDEAYNLVEKGIKGNA